MRYKREQFLSIEISSRPISKIGAIFSYKSIRRSETWIGDRQVGNAGLHIIIVACAMNAYTMYAYTMRKVLVMKSI